MKVMISISETVKEKAKEESQKLGLSLSAYISLLIMKSKEV